MSTDPYQDHRLAALYDEDNPAGEDHAHYRALADEISPEVIVDLGCGTGLLTVTLAGPGRRVIGIDPAAAMLELAAVRTDGDRVEWRCGNAERIGEDRVDLVLLTGNAAMHLIEDEWRTALQHIARSLRPGGVLAFETRNPAAQAWRDWTGGPTERRTTLGSLRETESTTAPDPRGVVTMSIRNEFLDSGEVIEAEQRLQFRDASRLRSDLAAVGLRVRRLSADWERTPSTGGPDERLLVVEAERPL